MVSKLEELFQVGTKIKKLISNNQIDTHEFSEASEKYSKLVFIFAPYTLKESYLKEHRKDISNVGQVGELDVLKFIGTFSFSGIRGSFEKNFKIKFGIDYDKEKYLITALPNPDEDEERASGGTIVAVHELN